MYYYLIDVLHRKIDGNLMRNFSFRPTQNQNQFSMEMLKHTKNPEFRAFSLFEVCFVNAI